jgi:soluble P-type ATPase
MNTHDIKPSHLEIPGWSTLNLKYIVMDFNGTLATDGNLIPGVKELLIELASRYKLFVCTADTHGTAKTVLKNLPLELHIVQNAEAKDNFARSLGMESVVAIGNGRNDFLMLKSAALGIAVLGEEGFWPGILDAASIAAPRIEDALKMLLRPARIVATLRH